VIGALELEAFGKLLAFDHSLMRTSLASLYERVRRYPVGASLSTQSVESICRAVDSACIWYWKTVLCLQRSAATTCLLRRHGRAAWLVVGAQQLPFRAHAWVELDGVVVNDKPYIRDTYLVLDRL